MIPKLFFWVLDQISKGAEIAASLAIYVLFIMFLLWAVRLVASCFMLMVR